MRYIKIIALSLLLFATGCQDNAVDKIKNEINIEYVENDTKDSVTNNIYLPAVVNGIELSWTTISPYLDIEDGKGLIKPITEDVEVRLSALFTYKDIKHAKGFIIIIKGVEKTFDFNPVIEKITIPSEVVDNITLPSLIDDVQVVWASNHEAITNNGVVTQQDEDIKVTLTATLSKDGLEHVKTYDVLVLKKEITVIDYEAILKKITLPFETKENLTLPNKIDGVDIEWTSNHDAITTSGLVNQQDNDTAVLLTAKAGDKVRVFSILVLKKESGFITTRTPIVEVRDMPLSQVIEIHGVVTSLMTNGNYTLEDQTGAIPVYFGSGKNSELTVGREYIIEGVTGNFQGLTQLTSPVVKEDIGTFPLPEVIDLTGYSLDYDDVTSYEAHVVTYKHLEVVAKETKADALEFTVKNEAGEQTNARLDIRVNNTPFAFEAINVGDIINLYEVTVGQYSTKAQFLFTRRSQIEARPKDPDIIAFYGVSNKIHTLGDSAPNFLAGITAKNGYGDDFTKDLEAMTLGVNLDVEGTYVVTVQLSTDPSVKTTYQLTVRKPIQAGDYTGYYQSLSGLSNQAFQMELRRLIQNTGKATGTTSQVKQVDRVNNTYYKIYTGMGPYGNREHVWPQSKLGATKDDLHNLRAANVAVNTARGNLPFAEDNSSFTGSMPYGKFNDGWYPGDEHIGDVARIILYVHIRYNLSLNVVGDLDMFLLWHQLDPVNDFEMERNDRIYTIQGNRNPFIDHPELVELYFGQAPTAFHIPQTLIQASLIMNQTQMF